MCDSDIVIPREIPSAPKSSYQLGEYVLVFFILISLFWIIGYSFNFAFLRKGRGRNTVRVGQLDNEEYRAADPARCFVFSIIASLILIAVWWAFF